MNLTIVQVIAIFAGGFCLGVIVGRELFHRMHNRAVACGTLYGNLPGEKEGKERA